MHIHVHDILSILVAGKAKGCECRLIAATDPWLNGIRKDRTTQSKAKLEAHPSIALKRTLQAGDAKPKKTPSMMRRCVHAQTVSASASQLCRNHCKCIEHWPAATQRSQIHHYPPLRTLRARTLQRTFVQSGTSLRPTNPGIGQALQGRY